MQYIILYIISIKTSNNQATNKSLCKVPSVISLKLRPPGALVHKRRGGGVASFVQTFMTNLFI